jgi:hypothetical protein
MMRDRRRYIAEAAWELVSMMGGVTIYNNIKGLDYSEITLFWKLMDYIKRRPCISVETFVTECILAEYRRIYDDDKTAEEGESRTS